MKKLQLVILILISISSVAQQTSELSLEDEAKTNKRLLPRYGLLPKSEEEIAADKKFIASMMEQPQFKGNRRAASNHFIELGFSYMGKNDLRTAMYRFNQAYLLDSTNTDIYWGYGAFYMSLGNFEEGKKQYMQGLSIAPENPHLLTDYGTYFMTQYFELKQSGNDSDAEKNLESALSYLEKSFKIDRKDQNTTYKLSICYLFKGNCEKAWYFYDECKKFGGQPITEEYTAEIKKKCPKQK